MRIVVIDHGRYAPREEIEAVQRDRPVEPFLQLTVWDAPDARSAHHEPPDLYHSPISTHVHSDSSL